MSNYNQKKINSLNDSSLSNSQGWHPNLWPPFTQIATSKPQGKINKGIGALLIPDNGPPLIDAISSWWVTLHGHSNPYIGKAIASQALELEQVIFADFSHPQAERIATRLSKATGLDRLFFSDNGSTAVEVALKIAFQWWRNQGDSRHQIIAFEGAYHGDTFGAMAVGERNLFSEPFEEMLFPVKRVPWPANWWGNTEVEKNEEEAIKKLEQLLETPTVAVILESLVQGAGGMAMVRPEFLKKVEKKVRQANTLLITDEVMSGFGRCGSLFAFQKASLKPDLIALSKGLTGGFLPMGVTMATEAIYQGFVGEDPKLTLWHGHSFTANPLGCAAANASLDLLEQNPKVYESFESRHLPLLTDLAKSSKIVKPRITGTISAFDIKVDTNNGYFNSLGKIVKAKAIENGVFIRPLGNIIYFLPPLCITDDELEKCYSVIKQAIKSLD